MQFNTFTFFLLCVLRGNFAVKADELTTVLRENSVDIACTAETFLNEAVPSEALDIPGYVIHHNDRKDGRRCGCARATRRSMSATDIA